MKKETKAKVTLWVVIGVFLLAVLLIFAWGFFTPSGQGHRAKNKAVREANQHTQKVRGVVSAVNSLMFVKRHGADVCFAVGNRNEVVTFVPCENVEGLLINPPTDMYGKPISREKEDG